MIKLKEIILIPKKLRIFDFDGTIARSDARIIVKEPNGNMKRLDGVEYAYYKLQPGEEFDFHEFKNSELTKPKTIKYTFNILKNIYNAKEGNREIYILTARTEHAAESIRNFLDTHGMVDVQIAAMGNKFQGNSDEIKKALWIEEKIGEGYNDILFFDDVPLNLIEVNKLKTRYPNIKLVTRLIKPVYN